MNESLEKLLPIIGKQINCVYEPEFGGGIYIEFDGGLSALKIDCGKSGPHGRLSLNFELFNDEVEWMNEKEFHGF